VAHTDLHGANLLLKNRNQISIIDFGLAKQISKLDPNHFQKYVSGDFKPGDYSQITPEFLYMMGIQNRLPESFLIAKLADDHLTFNAREAIFHISKKTQEREFQKFISQSRAAQARSLDSIFRIYWSKQDAWSIGTILILLYKDLLMNTEFLESSEYRQRGQLLEKVLEGLTNPDPGKRLDCAEALETYNPESKVLQIPGVRSWIQEQNQIRLDLEKLL
jgi:serine/threonine protein kinase